MPRIPDRHLQSVVHIFPSQEDADNGRAVGGSGFVVSYADEESPWRYQYVVTCEHSVSQGGHWVRLNHLTGTHTVHIPPDDWTIAPDDDIAVALLDLPDHVHPYWLALEHGALTREEALALRVGPGDECYMVGRLLMEDEPANYPIARFGNIAEMPNDERPVRDGRDRYVNAYLIEMRSHSGFSGSPTFLLIPANTWRDAGDEQFKPENMTRFRLLGIDTGHLRHVEPISERVGHGWRERADLRVTYNTDIALVAPIWKVVDLLKREDFVDYRRRHDAEIGNPVVVAVSDAVSRVKPRSRRASKRGH